ncbi:hypothetical protein HDU81_009544 [Chytriomyces hyalinus]|nr:hypothetical protein HDU81_009544 [Chytriomyces hyalinus]
MSNLLEKEVKQRPEKSMPDNRYLNVQYETYPIFQIDATGICWLSGLQEAVKKAMDLTLAYPFIQLYDKDNNNITELDDISDKYYKRIKKGGQALSIQKRIDPDSTVSASKKRGRTGSAETDSTMPISKKRDRTDSAETDSAVCKMDCYVNSDMTARFQAFKSAEVVDGCIVSPNQALLPYLFEDVRKLYVRKCYKDVFDLLVAGVEKGIRFLAITGTPGIGKSHFFMYVLHRLQRRSLNDSQPQPSRLNPKRIIYQTRDGCNCYDMENQTVLEVSQSQLKILVCQSDSLYIITGNSLAMPSLCVALFIASPGSQGYQQCIDRAQLLEWCFPVWTKDELIACRETCYPDVSLAVVLDRFRRYGISAKHVLNCFRDNLETALADISVVDRVQNYGTYKEANAGVHLLLHKIVSDDSQYHYSHDTIASNYVGEQLWENHAAQMVRNIQSCLLIERPTEICRHLFEIFGHRAISSGGITLNCRNLKTGEFSELTLDNLNGVRVPLRLDSLPRGPILQYHERSDCGSVTGIDSLSPQGLFRFTINDEQSIQDGEALNLACALYDKPTLYYVVPRHRFNTFANQEHLQAKGKSDGVGPIENLEQYVVELPFTSNWWLQQSR